MKFVFQQVPSHKIDTMIRAYKTKLLLFLLNMISVIPLVANDYTPAYIRQYKTIVQNEMDRVGIPASIKMAQAILESASGRSTLAKQSNNHFGIKCGKNWEGDEVYRHDDDYKNGLLVRSCFRAYEDPADSFIAHSNFLRNNRRYSFLFELDIYDYKSWARGLRKAGYATDPNYANKLINLIEKYDLFLLDLGIPNMEEEQVTAQIEDPTNKMEKRNKRSGKKDQQPIIITATADQPSDKRMYAAKNGYYTFRTGDKMKAIAKYYQLSLKELYFMNRMPFGAQPRPGEQIAVSSYIHLKKIPETVDPVILTKEDTYLFEETITISSL